jgi:hypothetical protein
MIHAVMALLLFATTPLGMAPLPAKYLNGGMFNSPDGWFAVHTPDGSQWFEMRKFDGDADPRWPDGAHPSVAWFMRNEKTPGGILLMERYAVSAPELNASYLDGLEADVRKAMKADVTVSDFSAELITSPVEGIRYSFMKTHKGKAPFYEFWYVTGWEHKVFIQATAPTRVEPKWLKGIVQSFRWLKMP